MRDLHDSSGAGIHTWGTVSNDHSMGDPAPPQPTARYTVFQSRLAALAWCLRDELTRRLLITGTETRIRGAAAHLNLADAILGALEPRGG